MPNATLYGAGLGLRREFLPVLRSAVPETIDFFEIAPENWMNMGSVWRRDLRRLARSRPIVAHGLSLSLGGTAPLDEAFLEQVKRFLDEYGITFYTEHLSWCSDEGNLYDLLPIPFTEEAVHHVAARIRRTQEILERRIAVENASRYVAPPGAEMSESEFVCRVLVEAVCDLHLDVNNVYVNSVNFGFDPWDFIASLPAARVVYMHVAGNYREADDLLIDTHGADVADPVWRLLDRTYARLGTPPTLLERDFNPPPLSDLLGEVRYIRALQDRHREKRHVRRA
jgi:uncharacterized protein (UPF0276 family)